MDDDEFIGRCDGCGRRVPVIVRGLVAPKNPCKPSHPYQICRRCRQEDGEPD